MHPGRAVKRAVTPKAVKRASRALHLSTTPYIPWSVWRQQPSDRAASARLPSSGMGIAQSAIGAQKLRPNAGIHSRPALLVRAAGFGVAKRPVMPLSECRSVRTMREYGAIRLSATGRSAAAACSGSRHRPASRGQVILDDLAHHHLARVAFPSALAPLVREKSGKTSMPSAARLREARTYSRPDFAARRRRWPSWSTRGTASGAWRTAGREAGAGGAGGRGAGPSADISLLSRGRGKLGADPVRTLFEHVAGPAGEDGAPGDVLLRAARDPGGQDHDRRAGQREERLVRAVPLISQGRGVRQARWAAESGTGSRCGYQLGRLEARRRTSVANGKTMSVPISALTTPPQSKMLVSPMPRPTVKMR